MKLSNDTIEVLKNFAGINANIVFRGGNKISTMSTARTILATAEVEESFPEQELGIYDLNEFLGVIGMFDEPELEYSQDFKSVKVSKGRSSVKYFFSDPSILISPSKPLVMPAPEVTFTLTQANISALKKAASTLGVESVVVRQEPGDNDITVEVTDIENQTSNSFKLQIDGPAQGTPYNFVFNIANFKMMPGDYDVQICGSSQYISTFTNTQTGIEYFIALEKESRYG